MNQADQECPVCFETKKLLPWQNPDCRHGFCSECIETLVEDEHTCPLCRREWIEDLPAGLRDEYINNNGPRRTSLVGSLHKVTRAVIICLQFAFNFYIIFLKFKLVTSLFCNVHMIPDVIDWNGVVQLNISYLKYHVRAIAVPDLCFLVNTYH